LSQVALAAALGVTEGAVQQWERNARHPRPDSLVLLAGELGQEIAFFYGDGDPAPAGAAGAAG